MKHSEVELRTAISVLFLRAIEVKGDSVYSPKYLVEQNDVLNDAVTELMEAEARNEQLNTQACELLNELVQYRNQSPSIWHANQDRWAAEAKVEELEKLLEGVMCHKKTYQTDIEDLHQQLGDWKMSTIVFGFRVCPPHEGERKEAGK